MYFDSNLWGYVLPDGIQYCHWGGRHLSRYVVSRLALKPTDRILEICCGQGGFLKLLPDTITACGLDISHEALAVTKHRLLVRGDAFSMPFANDSFTKVVSQDGDAWLQPSKPVLMHEIFRIIAPRGVFFYQSYAASERMSATEKTRTEMVLKQYGFEYTELPCVERVRDMFKCAGFRVVSSQSLHRIYARDNRRMLHKFRRAEKRLRESFPSHQVNALAELLECEEVLFAKNLWTGVFITATTDKPERR